MMEHSWVESEPLHALLMYSLFNDPLQWFLNNITDLETKVLKTNQVAQLQYENSEIYN